MNLRSIGFLFVVLTSLNCFAQESFYKTDAIRELKISFYQNNWDAVLDSLYINGDRERILASVLIDGVNYDSVGVRYKGFSSASINRVKNPFNIKLNYTISGQNHLGIDKLKLSNVIQDPSFVREVLSYEIARQYMPASEANYANVYINDTLIGLYSNIEAVNKEFLEKHFSSTDNVLVKGNPEEVDLFGENSNLSNTPGGDTLNYASLYSMESDYGWNELYAFIDTLNEYEYALEKVLNIDRALWMHALNYTLVNFDSYIGYAQNYYLYQDDDGLFNPILWDLNMSFGSFRLSDASVYYDGFSIEQAKTLDPLTHYNEFSVFARPLLRKLFENTRYRKMYMAHIRTIIEENFANSVYKNRAEELYYLIDESVYADTNKFYSYTDFQYNMYTTVSDLIDYPGIVDLMEGRTEYLSVYEGYQGAPQIDSIISSPIEPFSGDTVLISCFALNASDVFLMVKQNSGNLYESITMNDQGLYGDFVSGDGWLTASLISTGAQLDYYIYAENDSSGIFYPERAAYEHYSIKGNFTKGDFVINELMASNTSTFHDENGNYGDWIELYNTTENEITLNGLYLSDDQSSLRKWELPEITIPADDYLIVWADSDESPNGLHTNFKISVVGEALFLSDSNGELMDSVSFTQQLKDVSYGRFPNGTGDFTYLSPTFNANNNTADSIPSNSTLVIDAFPNPTNDLLWLSVSSQQESQVEVFDVLGRIVYSTTISIGITITEFSTTNYKPGIYLIIVSNSGQVASLKMVKL
jgi:spore coat protein CotH